MSPEGCEGDVNTVNFHVLFQLFEAKKLKTATFETKIAQTRMHLHPPYQTCPEGSPKKENLDYVTRRLRTRRQQREFFHVLVEFFEAKKEQTTTFETKIVLSACIGIHPIYPEDCRKKKSGLCHQKAANETSIALISTNFSRFPKQQRNRRRRRPARPKS